MATAYTSSFSWSNGIAASGREGDRDRDRVRAGVSRSGFRSSRPPRHHAPTASGSRPFVQFEDGQENSGNQRAAECLNHAFRAVHSGASQGDHEGQHGQRMNALYEPQVPSNVSISPVSGDAICP